MQWLFINKSYSYSFTHLLLDTIKTNFKTFVLSTPSNGKTVLISGASGFHVLTVKATVRSTPPPNLSRRTTRKAIHNASLFVMECENHDTISSSQQPTGLPR